MKNQLFLHPILYLAIALLFISCKKGDTGSAGPVGPQGPTGQQGVAGPAGKDGSVVYAGATPPSTTTGNVGDYYLNTSNGNFYGPKTNNGWGNSFSLVGPTGATGATGSQGQQGVAGTAGSKILSGTTDPPEAEGAAGDFYLNKTTYVLYGPKTAAGWGMGLELRGKDGTQGVRSFITQPFSSFMGPVFYVLPGISEEQLNNGYVAAMWRREQLLVNPGFYRLYPLPYSFTIARAGGGTTIATLYHFIVRGGQIGVTFVSDNPVDYELEPTADFKYNFRFVFIESGTVQQLSAKHPGVNFKDPQQVSKLLNL
ncbi:MAG TPA: hypothetical protein VL943_07955 [Niabella sp.]|nr:hypothetical protein [Niabella sp.]